MPWFDEKFEKFRKLPKSLMAVHITSKFIFGVGLGALLASYLQEYNWQLLGWLLIILSIALGIPGGYRILKKT